MRDLALAIICIFVVPTLHVRHQWTSLNLHILSKSMNTKRYLDIREMRTHVLTNEDILLIISLGII
jgi:hypothetical protein